MNLQLISFSQEASISNPEDIKYFLVFKSDSKLIKLPVPKETTTELIRQLYDEGSEPDESDDELQGSVDDTQDADEFLYQEEEEIKTSEDEEGIPSI